MNSVTAFAQNAKGGGEILALHERIEILDICGIAEDLTPFGKATV